MDNTVFKGILMGVGAFILILLVFTLTGTIVFFIWPVAVQAFPGLVFGGVIASHLTWWQAVCLSWLVPIITGVSSISSSISNKNKKTS